MPKPKKPRKKYRPRPVLSNPVGWVVAGNRPLIEQAESQLTTARIKNSDALLRIMHGEATRDTMDLLLTALNMGLALQSVCDIGRDYRQEFLDASEALEAVCRRGVVNADKFICRAPELNAIRDMMAVHDAQLQVCTTRQFETAYAHVMTMIRRNRVTRIVDR